MTLRQALTTIDPEMRLRFAARIARQIHDASCPTFDPLRGAGVIAPELAKLEQQRERQRYERQEQMISSLRDARRPRPELDQAPPGTSSGWSVKGEVYRC